MEINNKILVSSIGATVVAVFTGGFIANVIAIKKIKKNLEFLNYSDGELTIENKFRRDDCNELRNDMNLLKQRVDSLEKSNKK